MTGRNGVQEHNAVIAETNGGEKGNMCLSGYIEGHALSPIAEIKDKNEDWDPRHGHRIGGGQT